MNASGVPPSHSVQRSATRTRPESGATTVMRVGSYFERTYGASTVLPFAKGGYWNPPGPAIANTNNGGPHGLSEILYAFTSQTENNGSAFAGLTVSTPWYNFAGALCMLFGRFLFIIPSLAIAGSLASKKVVPTSAGTLPTHGALFVGLLVSTVIVVGALTFFPALSLAPIVEHFLMHQGKLVSMVVSLPIWS